MKFAKILVPVDFSNSSLRALELAREIGEQFGSEVHLFHSYPCNPPIVSPYAPAVPVDYLDAVRSTATQQLHEWREKFCPADMKVVEHLSHFAPCEAIADLAEEIGADLIIMGTRGLSGLKHVLLGSVAERVVRIAPCPVLTAKDAPGEAAA